MTKDEITGEEKVENDPQEELIGQLPEDEVAIIESFLERFVMQTESAKKKNQVDIKLMLKALPKKIDESNVGRCDNFNFTGIQLALIAFDNGDHVTLQKYFDGKNKQRLGKLWKKAFMTETMTVELKRKSQEVLTILK